MASDQLPLFKRKTFDASAQPAVLPVAAPSGESTILSTIPAYYAYLQSGGYSQYTPKLFVGDVKALGLFLRDKKLGEITTHDIQHWITTLKTSPQKQYTAKTISRKISAINNYFMWLVLIEVLSRNPALAIRNHKIISPLPDILFESDCQRLFTAASADSRTYLLILLLLETGIKKEELLALTVSHVDLSNKYAPEVWIKHTGTKVKKDRKLKLPTEVVPVFADYVKQYEVTESLFPYTRRFVEMLLSDLGHKAGLTKKVTASILRDTCAVRQLKRGEGIEKVLQKLGLSEATWEDAKEKYLKLTSQAL